MLFSDFYDLFGVLLFLGLLKRSLTVSPFNSFLIIFLGSCLSFCFFENPFLFLPIPLYFTQSYFQSFFAWLKGLFTNSFLFGENQKDFKPVSAITEKGKKLAWNEKFSDERQNPSTLLLASPLEVMQKYHYWAGFVLSLVSIYISNQVALTVLRRLNFTEEWVKGMVGKGWPRWLFFWLRFDKPGQLTE